MLNWVEYEISFITLGQGLILLTTFPVLALTF